MRAVQRIVSTALLTAGLCSAALGSDMIAAAGPAVAATPKTATPKQPTPKQIAARVLATLNSERRAHHLKALVANAHLVRSAHAHNLVMARTGVLSHQERGEAFFATRIQRAGYQYSYAGENIGVNSLRTAAGAVQLETAMYNEKPPENGHRLNILSSHFTNVGIDVVISHGELWLTEDFGRPR